MDRLKAYDELVAQCPHFKRKGKNMPYTSANGYMFSLFNKDGELGIRFDKKVQESYLKNYNTTLFHSHGAVMKGYILVTDEMLANTKNMLELLNESYQYVMSLPPK